MIGFLIASLAVFLALGYVGAPLFVWTAATAAVLYVLSVASGFAAWMAVIDMLCAVAAISGFGFCDKPHTQKPHAPNFAELHPVTAIKFISGCGA